MKRLFSALALAALCMSSGAQAVTFDFAALAHLEKTAHGREIPFAMSRSGGWSREGITVTASAGPGAHPFLDGGWWNDFGWNEPSGLGSCDVDDCNADPHDGITSAERITLTFDRNVRLGSIFVRESSDDFHARIGLDHTPFTGRVSVNGVTFDVTDGNATIGLLGRIFDFSPLGERDSVYLSAATVAATVPLPATGLLLAGGLAALGFSRRRTKASGPA